MQVLKNIQINVQIPINKSKREVWDALLNDIESWWHKDFYVLAESQIILEPFAGGRLYEKTIDGSEGLWYTVSSIHKDQTIELFGHLRPEFGGPATSLLKINLSENNGTTVLQIYDSLYGVVDEAKKQSIESGWKLLFTEGLKKYIEQN
ncbi:MAG: hypothetical protein D8M58_17700 [Calditrichaeota bacterium]|nr:MAG: hypothetical protein DWQ03_01615 [Calditrichota bacterium]MBL1207242.1 hypothetical protein [Calditrichota bacterium]NOG47075.1 hypothetical protein [Calditrichota bacterium]